jgi:hypothetical protein
MAGDEGIEEYAGQNEQYGRPDSVVEDEKLLGGGLKLRQVCARQEPDHGGGEHQDDPGDEEQEEDEEHAPCQPELKPPVRQPGFASVARAGHIRLPLPFLLF